MTAYTRVDFDLRITLRLSGNTNGSVDSSGSWSQDLAGRVSMDETTVATGYTRSTYSSGETITYKRTVEHYTTSGSGSGSGSSSGSLHAA